MGLLETVLSRPGPATVLYECRHCGEKPSRETDRCPVCASTEIARYEL